MAKASSYVRPGAGSVNAWRNIFEIAEPEKLAAKGSTKSAIMVAEGESKPETDSPN